MLTWGKEVFRNGPAAYESRGRTGSAHDPSNLHAAAGSLFAIHASLTAAFAHESLSVTVRLKTGSPTVASGSRQKYPIRSNCTR